MVSAARLFRRRDKYLRVFDENSARTEPPRADEAHASRLGNMERAKIAREGLNPR
jgi:hypothetical protein